MVNTSLSVDTSGWTAALDRLAGPLRVKLARSMGVAGGEVLRDEAQARAPRSPQGAATEIGPRVPLADAIYLAFRDSLSTDKQVQYTVTWNKSKAPHGHLIEFGHWRTHVTYKGSDGNWYSDPKRLLPSPIWVPAYPFMRPAYDAAVGRAVQAMMERGRIRLPELLAGSEVDQ